MDPYGIEISTSLQPVEITRTYKRRRWVGPAWMWACVTGSVIAMSISVLALKLVSVYLGQYRSGTYAVVSAEVTALVAFLEGGLIGYFQWRVLRRLFPTMSGSAWVGASIIAAGSGLVLSWLPTSFALTTALASRIGDLTPAPAAVLRLCLVTGALVGLVWGVAQYTVLHLHVHRAGSWITASIFSWTISFIFLYIAAFWPDRTTDPLTQITLGGFAGLFLGFVIGVVQGRVLTRANSRLLVSRLESKRMTQ